MVCQKMGRIKMKEKRNVHLKVQELCDCYATTDPLKEMSTLSADADTDEAALKWLALAALHGVNNNAEKISISRAADGSVSVRATYRESDLPTPGPVVGQKVLQAVREITHMEEDKGKLPLALGIRDSSIEVRVAVKAKDGKEKVSITFPK